MRNFLIRTISGVLFVVLMVGAIIWRPDSMILLFAIITGLALWEFCGLVNQVDGVQVNRFICTVAGIYFFLSVAALRIGIADSFVIFVPYVLTMIYLLVSELYLKQKNPINDWAYTFFSQMYVAMPLSLINVLAFQTSADGNPYYDCLLPLSVFVFLWVNDTGAYCVGSLLGKHKLFPRVSPGKSWEGSIGGAVFVLIVAGVVGYLTNDAPTEIQSQMNLFEWMGLGCVVVIFGTWGDLVESLFKRTLGIKDSGNILPGHGGMLDRFDSSLLAIPAAVVYLYTLTLF